MLSTTAEYALRIMITLAEAEGQARTADEIAESTKVPPDYAAKVLQWLSRANLVAGRRGRRGGFRLDCDPDATTLLDVVNAIEPVPRITECPLGREAHRSQLCPLHARLDEVMALLEESLEDMTIQSVIEGRRGETLCPPDRARLRVSAKRKGAKKPARRRR